VLIEAIAAGVPIICTPSRGVDEFIDGGNGYKAPSHAPAAIADTLRIYFDDARRDSNIPRSRARNAQSLLAEQFCRRAQMDKIRQVYGL
jgi:glycosyltransferase involved in cell wall biosynthesis